MDVNLTEWHEDQTHLPEQISLVESSKDPRLYSCCHYNEVQLRSLTDPLVKPDCLLPCQSLSQDLKNVLPVLFLLMEMMAQTTKTMKL